MARKGEGRITKSFGIPVSKIDMYEQFEKIAIREGQSASELITIILEEYTKAHKAGNTQHLISSFQDNEDFHGFPSMALDVKGKRNYIRKVLSKDSTLRQKMQDHVDQWSGILRHG